MFVMCQICQSSIEDWVCSMLPRKRWTDGGTPENFLPQEVGGNNRKYFSRPLARNCWNVTSHQRAVHISVYVMIYPDINTCLTWSNVGIVCSVITEHWVTPSSDIAYPQLSLEIGEAAASSSLPYTNLTQSRAGLICQSLFFTGFWKPSY